MARALDIGVTAWSPLAGGVLSGKYSNRQEKANEQKRYNVNNPMSASFVNERNISIATEVQVIAKEINKTPSQIALNWIRQQQLQHAGKETGGVIYLSQEPGQKLKLMTIWVVWILS